MSLGSKYVAIKFLSDKCRGNVYDQLAILYRDMESNPTITILKSAFPLELDFLGPGVVNSLLSGIQYVAPDTSRPTSIADTAAFIGCVISVLKLVQPLWLPYFTRQSLPSDIETDELQHKIRTEIDTYLRANAQAAKLFEQRPRSKEKLLQALRSRFHI